MKEAVSFETATYLQKKVPGATSLKTVRLICSALPSTGATLWRSWLRHCATNQKVAGSIPDGVIGIFH